MCGILFQAKRGTFSHPKCLVDVETHNGRLWWETEDIDLIKKEFLAPDLQDVSLTEGDKLKLSNIDRIRELNKGLVELGNNVKKKPEMEKRQKEVEDELQELTRAADEEALPETHLNEDTIFESLVPTIASRGPDYLKYVGFDHKGWGVQTFSSVLSLRQPFTKQPLQMGDDLILQFNGELYNKECFNGNDTSYIKELLFTNVENCSSRSHAILKTVCQLDGEFAFCIFDQQDSKIYFGRDAIGKRSLTYSLLNGLVISSVPSSRFGEFLECDNTIHIYDLKNEVLSRHKYSEVIQKYSVDTVDGLNFDSIRPCFDDHLVNERVEALYEMLKKACYSRQSTIHSLHTGDLELGILFSGGLDCTILTALICENALSSDKSYGVDLLSVGFENPRTNQKADSSPDRVLSKKSWFNLSQKYNTSNFQLGLIEVDVSYREWLMNRRRVQRLMYPCETEMDLSIAIAFYFASKFEGRRITLKENGRNITFEDFLSNESEYTEVNVKYKSDNKVLFSGLGADELFAGYSRHEALFGAIKSDSNRETISNAYEQLSQSLNHDIEVIHRRNLGRDDRVISSWGKELRYPYLDPSFVGFAMNKIEPDFKFAYKFEVVRSKRNKEGKLIMIGERKFILRRLAERLGLHWVKNEPKRAIQFGAKSAKLEIGQSKTKGTDVLQ